MTAVNLKLYKLLIKLGATEQEAEEVSNDITEAKNVVLEQSSILDKEISTLDKRFMQQEMKIEKLESNIRELKVMIGVLITLNVSVLAGFIVSLILK